MPSGPWRARRAGRLAWNVQGEECTPRSPPEPRNNTRCRDCRPVRESPYRLSSESRAAGDHADDRRRRTTPQEAPRPRPSLPPSQRLRTRPAWSC
eukprot:4873601-Prymnesium_polylepis.1